MNVPYASLHVSVNDGLNSSLVNSYMTHPYTGPGKEDSDGAVSFDEALAHRSQLLSLQGCHTHAQIPLSQSRFF